MGDFRSHHAEELEVFTDGRQNDVDLAHISLTWHMKVLSDFHFVNSEYYNGDDDHGAMKSWRRSAPLGTRQSFWRTLWSGVRNCFFLCLLDFYLQDKRFGGLLVSLRIEPRRVQTKCTECTFSMTVW